MAEQPDQVNRTTPSDHPAHIRRDIAETRRDMSRTVDQIQDRVSPSRIKERQMNRARARWTEVRYAVMGVPDSSDGPAVQDPSGGYVDGAKETVQQAPEQTKAATRGNPVAAGLIAFGVGALAGSLLPSTEAERRAAGRLRDEFQEPVRAQLQSSGQEVKESLQQRAEEAKSEVQRTAQDAADTVKEHAQESKEQVKSHANDAADQAKGSG